MEAEALVAGKKNATRLGAYLVFLDESGFLLIPTIARTWAPRGRTPRLWHRYRRDKVSAISAISVSPKRHRLGLFYRLFQHNIKHADVVGFLRLLLRHLPGRVIVLLDSATIHRGAPFRDLCARHRRLRLEYFPGYAPELNPDEGVWSLLKRRLANGRPDDVDELQITLIERLENLRHHRDKLRACIQQSDLSPFLR